MSIPKPTGDQIADGITFAIYAKHLAPDAPAAAFQFWLDKCIDFDPAATLRWIRRAQARHTLTPEQSRIIDERLRARPRLLEIARRAGIERH